MTDQTRYLVKVKPDEAVLAVVGRASYLNCQCVSEFFSSALSSGKLLRLKVDLSSCTGMDSTFLGMLAGAALKMRKRQGGETVLLNASGRNLELVQNLGLDRIVRLENLVESMDEAARSVGVGAASTGQILSAHKDLIEADPKNLEKFEDVIKYLSREAKDSAGENI